MTVQALKIFLVFIFFIQLLLVASNYMSKISCRFMEYQNLAVSNSVTVYSSQSHGCFYSRKLVKITADFQPWKLN